MNDEPAAGHNKAQRNRLSNGLLWMMVAALAICCVTTFATVLNRSTPGLVATGMTMLGVLLLAAINLRRTRPAAGSSARRK